MFSNNLMYWRTASDYVIDIQIDTDWFQSMQISNNYCIARLGIYFVFGNSNVRGQIANNIVNVEYGTVMPFTNMVSSGKRFIYDNYVFSDT